MSGPNPYLIQTVEEATRAVQEASKKEDVLHQGRIEAYDAMRDAIVHHDFMVSATRQAREETDALAHRLETLIRRDARELVLAEEPARP